MGLTLWDFQKIGKKRKSYVIGQKEMPYPMVEIDFSVNKDENIKEIKVVLQNRKSLIPCRL